jgi:hypothetical protein
MPPRSKRRPPHADRDGREDDDARLLDAGQARRRLYRPANTQFAVAVHVSAMPSGLPRDLQSSEVRAASVGSNPVHIRRILAHLRDAGLVAPSGSQRRLAPSWRFRRKVSDGTRTRDRLDHNQELYLLSYAHREAFAM